MKRKECVLSCPVLKRVRHQLFEKVSQTDRDGRERYVSLYQNPRNCRMKLLEECIGEHCKVGPAWPSFGQVAFHTHPTESWPSRQDLFNVVGLKKGICLGVVDDEEFGPPGKYKVLCWKLPDWAKQFKEGSVFDAYDKFRKGKSLGKKQERLLQLIENWHTQCRDRYGRDGEPFCVMEAWP